MDYVKLFLKRGLYGIFIGVFMGQVFMLIPAFTYDSLYIDSHAYIVNFIMCAVLGFWCTGISIFYQIDEWSLLRQTITHCLALLPYFIPAYYLQWLPQEPVYLMVYMAGFILIYGVVWLVIKRYWQRKAAEINALLRQEYPVEE